MNHLPLAFSQQLAIDSIWRRLAEGSGSFAINGPPGTGKTTVLRDLVAAVMVERAKRLARLADPESAFVGKRNWRVGKFSRAIAVWRDELRGFEMVVASSNNGAVENVTLEIPMREAIDPGWLPGAEHFAGFATEVAGRPCWALLAARLGNKQNRGDFVRRFWYGEETEDERSDEEGKSGFLAYLKRLATEPFDWRDEVRRFASALRSENEIRERRTSWARTVEELPAAEATLVCAEREREAAVARRDDSNARFTAAEAFAQKSEAARVLAAKRRLDHRAFRPGFWETVFTWGKVFREWRARDLLLARDLEKEEEDVRAAAARVSECGSGRAARAAELAQVEARLSQAGVAVVRLRIDLAQAASALGDAFPDPAAWRDPSNEAARELSAPWSDRAWSDARAAVFIAALRLHRAFLAANAGRMRMSLQAAMDVLSGNVPEEAPREAVAHAWSALFFIAPVVSTTFASFDRLFSHLGRESLGWLLIDEAGQATPQAAVGALWRARRAVVVGDPLQLEPVVTIPLTVQQALRRHFRVAETWLPGGTSLQELADRASEIGTYLASDEGEDRWVGAPLRVHRRCESPMFEISNQIAYGGAMVYGTPVREPYSLPPSCWLDVAGGEADSHWIEAEGRALGDLLTELRLHGVDPADVFLISPFRAVVAELSAFVRQHDGLRAGTIHTMQGKESKVVILVLGGNPKKPGAKAWAARTPNLLNVAVSRAQRRLYVIGNRAAWSRERFFSRLARHLPSRQRPG
ncbi:MAG TPA: ATP-binding protein [Thermoanaerobaculia bacterium]|nr:ATP-binding protein [Thermoanaerobaculia bacterium]